MYLLDTNHCSQAILGNTNVLRRLEYIENSVITTCAIVQGELIDMALAVCWILADYFLYRLETRLNF